MEVDQSGRGFPGSQLSLNHTRVCPVKDTAPTSETFFANEQSDDCRDTDDSIWSVHYDDGLEVYQFDGLETHYNDGLEIVGQDEKQVFNQDGKQAYNLDEKEQCAEIEKNGVGHTDLFLAKQSRLCGFDRHHVLFGLLLLVVLGMAAGLGAGLSRRPQKSLPNVRKDTHYSIGGSIDPAYYSTTGAWNGSGFALTSGFSNDLELYFQHWTGSIRLLTEDESGTWSGGSQSSVIATDAKNSTPLSVGTIVFNNTQHQHLFYIDNHNRVKQKSRTNITNTWQDGLINGLNLTVLNADLVGFQACWYGNGCAESASLKLPPGLNITNNDDCFYGMLWFATDVDRFERYAWYDGLSTWVDQGSFPGMNSRAGVGCYTWAPDSVDYAMLVDSDNTLDLWWRDSNASTRSTAEHPINSWTNASNMAIKNVYPSTSLGYMKFLYTQMADYTVEAFNISFSAENSSLGAGFTVSNDSGPVKGIPGTHLSVISMLNKSGGYSSWVFFQTAGDDVTRFSRNISTGIWTSEKVPIPYD